MKNRPNTSDQLPLFNDFDFYTDYCYILARWSLVITFYNMFFLIDQT